MRARNGFYAERSRSTASSRPVAAAASAGCRAKASAPALPG
ncbi:hypothetical protein ACFYOT_36215 [Saccharothrix saharensis]